jgi:hypothetical protein
VTYFLGREQVTVHEAGAMGSAFFGIPRKQVIELGIQLEV